MNNYDFKRLSPIEFEELVNDLLEKVYNFRIERFKVGRDRGIDGRFTNEKGEKVIIQSKHYAETGYKGLINDLKKKTKNLNGVNKEVGELVKVEKLKKSGELHRYIFTTSVGLNSDRKKEIFNIFDGYIENETDIYGIDELISILSNNKDLEDKYYKLWLTSTNVLKNILSNVINNDINGRSKVEIEKYIEKNKFFYITNDFNKAIDILSKNNVLIITGEPGIGKSTLSEQICLKFVSKGNFKFFKISKDINEVEKIWNDSEKQIFYFDDFLGSNYLDKIDGKDSDIKNFIERIKRSKGNKEIEDKIFILNSRTTILKSGIENSSIHGFKEEIKENEFVLQIKKISKEEKAYILYNHLNYSDLYDEYIEKIYENQNYKKIINHQNYNPRLIEFITNKSRVTVGKDEYISFIINNLDNPREIWKQVFEKQSNYYVNFLVNLTIFNGGGISEDVLKNRYNTCVKEINHGIIPINYEFKNVIKIAIENFLIRESSKGVVSYSLINPSITDYILHKYIDDSDFLIDIFNNLGTHQGLEQFKKLYENGFSNYIFESFFKEPKNFIKISKETYLSVINGLYEKGIENKNHDYIIYLFSLGYSENNRNIINTMLQKFVDNYVKLNKDNIPKLIELLSNISSELRINNYNFLINYIDEIDFNLSIFDNLGNILNNFKELDEDFGKLITTKILGYLESSADDFVNDVNFDDYLSDGDNPMDLDLDVIIEDIIHNKLPDLLLEITGDYDIYNKLEDIDLNQVEISKDYLEDLYSDFKANFNYDNNDYEKFKEENKVSNNNFDEIDYIFANK